MSDAHIDNPRQLEALKARFLRVQGQMELAAMVQAELEASIKGYLENVAVVAGIELDQGDKVSVDWISGEVTLERPEPLQLPNMNGVAS